jgi:hypothetical protein
MPLSPFGGKRVGGGGQGQAGGKGHFFRRSPKVRGFPPQRGGDRRVLSPSPCGEAGIPRDKPLPLSPPALKGKTFPLWGGSRGGKGWGGEGYVVATPGGARRWSWSLRARPPQPSPCAAEPACCAPQASKPEGLPLLASKKWPIVLRTPSERSGPPSEGRTSLIAHRHSRPNHSRSPEGEAVHKRRHFVGTSGKKAERGRRSTPHL